MESGLGRLDLLLVPDTLEYKGMIIEVKRSETNEPNAVDRLLQNALTQIERNQYSVELRNQGYTDYFAVAVAFYGKQMFIKHTIGYIR